MAMLADSLTGSDFASPDFWHQLQPELQITDQPFREAAAKYPLAVPDMTGPLRQIVEEGYLQLPPLLSAEQTARLAGVVKQIHSQGLPPVFAFVFDELWQLFASISQITRPILGAEQYIQPEELWVWYVERDHAGFSPHRDYLSKRGVRADGTPPALNIWVPLTDASLLNSCVYVLPRNRDPNLPNRPQRTKVSHADLRNIRALPARAGSVLCWDTHLLHWGSRSSVWADGPRISVAVYLRSSAERGANIFASEGWLLSPHTQLPLEQRLDTIRGAIRQYKYQVKRDYPLAAERLLEFAGCDSRSRPRFKWPF